MSKLAILGGKKEIAQANPDLFTWPIVTQAHRDAVLKVIDKGSMSGIDVTTEFETRFAQDFERKYALMSNNGTSSIHGAFFGLGIGQGDEVICPSITFWASVLQVYSLQATPVFADIHPETLCIDPVEFERCISERTKAVVVVHYAGHAADMDAIMSIARKHDIKVLEDCSHAHRCYYKGKQVGTFGDVSGYSLMSLKSFPVGEAGILTTDDQEIYERAILFGHYARHGNMALDETKKYAGLPCGGYKYRPQQCSSAFGLVQLDCYKEQFSEIDKAMTYFCDLIDELPGIKSHRPPHGEGYSKGGWYLPLAHYKPEELGGLSNVRFVEAVSAEGVVCRSGCNKPLHGHPVFHEMDIYHQGKPTRMANLPDGLTVEQIQKPLKVANEINTRILELPAFKKYDKDHIERTAAAFKKVVEHHGDLMKDIEAVVEEGGYGLSTMVGKN